MRKIEKSKYKDYIGYAEKCTANRVYPMSIAGGTQDGEIFKDDKGCILFWHYCGFAYISGNENPDAFEEIYQDFLTADTDRRFLLITSSAFIKEYYSSRGLLQLDNRIEYAHSGILEDPAKADDDFYFDRISAENIKDIRGRIIPSFSWKNSDTFLRYGFGFLAKSRRDGCFAAAAFSSAVSPEEVDIGVETAEAYRRRGLASCLAYMMCEEIMRQGRKPVWAHAETNAGSRKTALSIGFEPCGINTVIRKKQ